MNRDQQVFPTPEEQIGGWQHFLKVMLAIPVVGILTLATIILGVILYSQFVPAATAETFIPELNVSARLELYYTVGDRDSGEYLIVRSPNGRVVGKIGTVMDWANWSRTSLYITDDRKIAVLGVAYSDYIVDPSSLTMRALTGRVASDDWTYLGAFDGGHSLKFISASEQRECNPTAMHDEEPDPSAARPQSRRESCRGSAAPHIAG